MNGTAHDPQQPPPAEVVQVEDGAGEQADYGRPVDLIALDGEQVEIDLDDIALEGNNVALGLLLQIQAKAPSWLLIAQEHLRENRLAMSQETLRVAVQELEKRQDRSGIVDALTMQAYIAILQARSSPKVILRNAKQDQLPPNTHKASDFLAMAAKSFQAADQNMARLAKATAKPALLLCKAMFFTTVRNFGEAEKQLNQLMRIQPHNLLGLMCQGRVFLQTKRPELALKAYQTVLRLKPDMRPDPRVGLGLAYWLMGDLNRARKAWSRALQRDASCTGAAFLSTLADYNEARAPSVRNTARQRSDKQVDGIKTFGKLFGATQQKLAPVALSLIRNTELQGQIDRAIKLAERAAQYADTSAHSRRALSERCRLAYVAGDLQAVGEYAKMMRQPDAPPDTVVEIIAAQLAIQAGNYREALNVIETAAKKLGQAAVPLEMNLVYALLLAYPHPGMTAVELATNVKVSRDILNQLHETYKSLRDKKSELAYRLRGIAEDPLVFVQLAKLWQKDNLEKAIDAYRTAIEIHARQAGVSGQTERDLTAIRMNNNLATLYLLHGNEDGATQLYEQAIGTLGEVKNDDEQMLQTTLLYNLGRAYEGADDLGRAAEAYRGLLAKHPEYTNAKLRLADISMKLGRANEADRLIKQCQASDEKDAVVRAYTISELSRQDRWDELRRLFRKSVEQGTQDVYTIAAQATSYYHRARESKGDEVERKKAFLRSAEAFGHALAMDPSCSFAAQGLAISIAEDNLPSSKKKAGDAAAATESRSRAFDVALSIFNRIKDSLPGTSVLVNSAHCHFGRGEEERAVETYLAASAMHGDKDVQILLYLTRAYYQLANKTNSYPTMLKAVSWCQRALHLKPADKAILYNLAMIQQKAAQLVLDLDPSKRTLTDVRQVITQAEHSTQMFRTLAELQERPLPYDPELSDQRSRYGESLQRRGAEQLEVQQEYEADIEGKNQAAKEARDAERRRLAELDARAREEREAEARAQAEKRKQENEEQTEWRKRMKEEYEVEEARARSKKERRERGGGDDGVVVSGDEGEKKPKRGRKPKKVKHEEEDDLLDGDEAQAQMTDGEEDDAAAAVERSRSASKAPRPPKKKRPAVLDPDGDDAATMPDRPSKKSKFKSAAVIDDSDDE